MYWRTLAILALPMALCGAGDAPLDRATLRGLTALGVIVDKLDPAIEDQGVARDELQSRITARLQDFGIKVDKAATEFVGLRVTQVRGSRGPYAVSVTIGVYQPVLLARDHNIKTATQTWEVETILLSEPKLLKQAFMTTLDELADRLATAYQSVNPK